MKKAAALLLVLSLAFAGCPKEPTKAEINEPNRALALGVIRSLQDEPWHWRISDSQSRTRYPAFAVDGDGRLVAVCMLFVDSSETRVLEVQANLLDGEAYAHFYDDQFRIQYPPQDLRSALAEAVFAAANRQPAVTQWRQRRAELLRAEQEGVMRRAQEVERLKRLGAEEP